MQLLVLFILLLSQLNINAQVSETFCSSPLLKLDEEEMLIPSFGPVGTLKILVFLVKFSDDDFLAPPITDPWPLNMNYMPPWGPTLVSSTMQSDYPDPSLSGYFQDMSLSQFHVIGDVYFYEPQFNQSYYYPSSGRHIGYLVEEILLHFDNQINYSAYDNWSGTLNQPDGFVDMIKICFRNAHIAELDPPLYQGIARLTGWQGRFGSLPYNVPLEIDNIKISPISSGTVNNGVFDPHYGLPVMAHELGHYLFGLVHFTGIGFHGLMDGEGTGIMSSYEREKLGWIIPIPIETDTTDAIIPDAITTGVVRKIIIPNSNNYFLIDNHQRISFYESSWLQHHDGPLVSPGTGVLITHCTPYSVDVESAFGRYNFERTWFQWNNPPLSDWLYTFPFYLLNTNRQNGEDKLNLRNKRVDPLNWDIKKSHPDKLGSLQDFFNIGYNQLFSSWSNPSTYPDVSKIAVELLQIDQYKNVHLNIYLQDANLAPPSKPQNLGIAWSNNHPKLTWETSLEPDLQSYKIWKYASGSSMIAATVIHNPANPTHTWIDYNVDRPKKFAPGIEYIYKVKAVDNTNKESIYSDQVSINGIGDLWKNGEDEPTETALVDEYKLFSNYPNPFNPSTTISYTTKEAGLVKLKVFDILGSEVAVLVNETKEAGNHSVDFNAANLPSGVYIYTLQVNGFTNSKKMLLLK